MTERCEKLDREVCASLADIASQRTRYFFSWSSALFFLITTVLHFLTFATTGFPKCISKTVHLASVLDFLRLSNSRNVKIVGCI